MKIIKRGITVSAVILITIQSGLSSNEEVFAFQVEKDEKELILSGSEKNIKKDIPLNIEDKIDVNQEYEEVNEKEKEHITNEYGNNGQAISDETKSKGTIITQVAALINQSSFQDVINVFSNSLYDKVPDGDESEGQKYEITDLETTYNVQIKENVEEIAQLLVSVNSFETFDEISVKKQLVLLSYLMRWGTFSDQSTFWKELYTRENTLFSDEESKNLNQQFIRMFAEDPVKNLASKNVNVTFETVYKSIGKDWTYKKSVEEYLTQVNKISDYSEWFYSMFPGKMYKDHYKGTSYDVGIWNRGKVFDSFLPYLLTQSKESNLIIAETRGEIFFTSPANYNNDQEKIKEYILKSMEVITNTLELYDHTIQDKDTLNLDKIMGLRAVLDTGKRWLNPQDSLSYELYRVAGYLGSYGGAAAQAGTGKIEFQFSNLDDPGTLAHEFSHELDSLFNAGGEFYSTYVNNIYRQKALYVNTFANGKTIFNEDDNVANSSPANFTTKLDLVNYAKNMEDLAYVLDGVVATKVLELPLEEQVKYIKIAYVHGETGALNTEIEDPDNVQVRDVTVEELKQLNIRSIEDLIDHDAVIMEPGDNNKNILRNHGQGNGTTLTYSAFFLSNGKPFDHNHRIINTLLAYNGWEALKTFNVTYDQEAKDNWTEGANVDEVIGIASLSALRKVFNDESLTYRSLIKRRYQEVMKKVQEEGVLDKSYQELLNDFHSSELNNFYEFKLKKATQYLSLSHEFSEPIFGINNSLFLNVSNYTELFEAVKTHPNAIINITEDISVEGIYAKEELPEFNGILNGKGNFIYGAQHSLFQKLNGAEIKNLVISKSQIIKDNTTSSGGLSSVANNSVIKNVHFTDSTIILHGKDSIKPIVGGIIGEGKDSEILDSSVQNVELSGSYVGGVIGLSDKTKLYNVYTTGKLSNSRTGDIRIGGIIGNGFNKTSIVNAYTNMSITGGNGILGSDYSYGNKETLVSNTLSLADILSEGKYKIYDGKPQNKWSNNYEVLENQGISSINIDNINGKSVSKKQVNTDLFKTLLQFGKESVWETTKEYSENNLPVLKNDDPRYVNQSLKGGNITVYYQDIFGKNLANEEVIEGNINDTYTSVEKTIKGYTLNKIKGNPSGKFTEQEQTVTYIYVKSLVHPIDPVNPDTNSPITPDDMEEHESATPGPLSIDYVSNLKFGEQGITGADMTYFAELDHLKDSTGKDINRPNFVQVTDKRESNTGWHLMVTQDTQFKSEGGEELKGAILSLKHATLSTPSDGEAPTANPNIMLIPGETSDVLNAKVNQGTGTWLTRFGKDEEEGKTSVSLTVPGDTKKVQGEYATSLTWTLTDTPA